MRFLPFALALAVLAWSGGTAVAPHRDPGKPPLHVDHVPSALRLVLLTYPEAVPPSGSTFAFVEAHPVTTAIESAAIALIAIPFPRPWRPARGGVAPALTFLAPAQARLRVSHGPPRTSAAY